MSRPAKHLYEFGEFRLDAAEHLLYRRDGGVVPLKPKVVETLELLVRERGRLIGKDELMGRLWPDTVVEESNLTQNIYLLRKVLGADSQGRNYIETIPKRGYRFTAEVLEVFDEETGATVETKLSETRVAVRVDETESLNATSPINSLAVLPMSNESDDPNAEYLSDGITESIINNLSQLPQLKVMARSTVFHYKSRRVAPQEAGRELGVGAVMTGRVLQVGERLIIRAELVDATTGWQLWGGQYDRYSTDILELQETIAREISGNLRLKLTGEEEKFFAKRHTESTEAYHLFIKGRYYLNKRLAETIRKAVEYFQRAIDVDPTYAPAYVGLADAYPLLTLYGALTPQEAYPRAEAAARRALEIDESFAEAHNSLGVIKLFYEWDWAGAEAEFRRAIELKPGYPDAHQRYGMLLTARGRFAEAVEELECAQALDPLSLITKTIGGYPFYYGRDYEQAAARFREVIEMDRNYSMAHFRLGLTYAQQGLVEEALAELRQSAKLSDDRDVVAALGYIHGLAGAVAAARAALAELAERGRTGFVSAYDKVLVHLGLGETKAALDWLERAYEEHSYWLIYLQVDPALDPLRANPRFQELLRKIFGPEADTGHIEISPPLKRRAAEDALARDVGADLVIEKFTSLRLVVDESEEAEESRGETRQPAINGGVSPRAALTAGSRSASSRKVLLLALVLLLAGGLAFGILLWARRDKGSAAALPFQNVRLKRLTDSGEIADAAISPDGKQVAYCSFKNDVWIQNLATGSRLQLLPENEAEEHRGLAFSPDGNQLYFYNGVKGKKVQLMRMPVLGGEPQRVLEDFSTSTAVAPDGKQFAFMRWYLERGEQSLIVSDGANERTVITRKMPDYFELWGKTVAWSPDDQHVACVEWVKRDSSQVGGVLIVNVADGSSARLPNGGHNWKFLYDLVWLPKGDGLLVVAREDASSADQIWRVSYPEGEWRKVTNDLNDYEKLSVSADANHVVAVQASDFSNLWLLPQANPQRARQITFGNRRTDGWGGLSWTPDNKIVFASNASGSTQIWVADADGANPRQLTYGTEASTQPFVSPDGRHIVYISYRDGRPHVWRMDRDGSNQLRLTEGIGETWPSVTPDGQEVIYTSLAPPFATIWSIPLAGGGAPRQLSVKYPVGQVNPAPDGKLLAAQFYDADSPSPWRIGIFPAAGGQPFTSFGWPLVALARWTPDGQSVLYLDQNYPYIWKQPVSGGERTKLLSLTLPERIYNFAFSPDNTQLVIARGRPQRDLLLIEDVK